MDRPCPGYTLDEGMGRLTMGLCLEQGNPLATGPKPRKKIAQVFEKSEAEYIYSISKIQIVANLGLKDLRCSRSGTPLAKTMM